jgi:hypothetical protein
MPFWDWDERFKVKEKVFKNMTVTQEAFSFLFILSFLPPSSLSFSIIKLTLKRKYC